MTSLSALLLPIIVAAVVVFILSSIIHMALPWHRDEYPYLENQGSVLDGIHKFGLAAGDYMLPRPKTPADMKTPEFMKMFESGAVMMTLMPPGDFAMGATMVKWFVYDLIVSLFAGYVASAALPPGTPYLKVFQVVGTSAFMAYSFALWPQRIWYKRSMTVTLKATIDGLVYGLFTAGVFGWLWPKG